MQAELAALTATATLAAAQTKQLSSLDAEVVSLQQLLKSVKAAMRVSARNSSTRQPAARTSAAAADGTTADLNSSSSSIFRRSGPVSLNNSLGPVQEQVVNMYSSLPRSLGDSSDTRVTTSAVLSATTGGRGLASHNSSSSLDARPPWTFYNKSPSSSLRRRAGAEGTSPGASLSGSLSLNGSLNRGAGAAAAAGVIWPSDGSVTSATGDAPLVRVTSLAELSAPVLGAGAAHRGRSPWARRSSVSTASDLGDAGSEVSGAASNIFNFLPPLDLTQFYK
jgi:hypothetical protein